MQQSRSNVKRSDARDASLRPIEKVIPGLARVFKPGLDMCYNSPMTRIILALLISLPMVARAATLEKPIYAEIYLKGGNDKLSGNVSAWDSSGFTLRVGTEDRSIKWPELTAS